MHDAFAHLVATAKMTRLKFAARFARAGSNFDRFVANQVNAERAADPTETLAAFRSASTSTATPPAPKITPIIETFVHGEDIRRPLGIAHEYPVAHVGPAVECLVRDRRSGGKASLDSLTLTAIDADFSLGSGPVVEGRAISLLLAASGRKSALAELSGPGIETLAVRD